jgi:two-component system, cell cycle sensor histidine kinase and response regulator CckA
MHRIETPWCRPGKRNVKGEMHDVLIGATADSRMRGLPLSQGTNVMTQANCGETIMVVEDDPGLRAMMGYLLRSYGYRMLEASYPGEAESLVRHFADPIHLVLMDVTLPGINGYELARTLLSLRPIPAMLFVSGYEQDHLALDRTICAKNEFLMKPFGPNVLITTIHGLLNAA